MYYLGVDGGGTKTAFEVIDEDGFLLSDFTMSSCNYVQVGKERFGQILREGAEAVCKSAGIQLSDLGGACIGIPSFGEIKEDMSDLIRISREALGANTKCANDVEVAWAGSLACQPGINLLAGTGSMGYGVDESGRSARSGGWGYFCGDEGSGYWLGKKLIELFTKEADGRIPKGPAYALVRQEFGLDSDFDFISVIYKRLNFERDHIARLQLLLNRAADQGDPGAVEFYRQGAREFAAVLEAIISKLHFDRKKKIRVSYSGGVFKAGDLIFSPLKEFLGKYPVELMEPMFSPVTGAALLAVLNGGSENKERVVENLKTQIR